VRTLPLRAHINAWLSQHPLIYVFLFNLNICTRLGVLAVRERESVKPNKYLIYRAQPWGSFSFEAYARQIQQLVQIKQEPILRTKLISTALHCGNDNKLYVIHRELSLSVRISLKIQAVV